VSACLERTNEEGETETTATEGQRGGDTTTVAGDHSARMDVALALEHARVDRGGTAERRGGGGESKRLKTAAED
jgi:hypothetical protein